eukprot:12912789-Prorocentrum_lima.AAC.1
MISENVPEMGKAEEDSKHVQFLHVPAPGRPRDQGGSPKHGRLHRGAAAEAGMGSGDPEGGIRDREP